jgi:hypothetical protein
MWNSPATLVKERLARIPAHVHHAARPHHAFPDVAQAVAGVLLPTMIPFAG